MNELLARTAPSIVCFVERPLLRRWAQSIYLVERRSSAYMGATAIDMADEEKLQCEVVCLGRKMSRLNGRG
jgi:hypothetical protein